MDSISARQVKGSPTIEIDPRFFFPSDVIDLRYASEEDPSSFQEVPALIDNSTDVNAVIVDNKLQAPGEISIVSQTIHVLPDGKQAIDVTIDVPGELFGTSYNVRISKA